MKTIRTVAGLNKLPVGAVILSQKYINSNVRHYTSIRIKCSSGEKCWERSGSDDHWSPKQMEWLLPALLLWSPDNSGA